jgi:hypothetical protein
LSLIKASASSLSKIALTFEVLDELEHTLVQFFSMHFPHLRSITLGIWDPTPPQIIDFLVAHSDTLEELCLGFDELDAERATVFIVPGEPEDYCLSRFRPETLSALKSFKGQASCLRLMALAGLKCLETIKRVCVSSGVGFIGWTEGWGPMFDVMEQSSVRCLSGVQELYFDLTHWDQPEIRHEATQQELRRITSLVGPSLEVWNGGLPKPSGPHTIMQTIEDWIDFFAHFQKLRIVYLPSLPISSEDDGSMSGESLKDMPTFVVQLAGNCPLLHQVYVYNDFLDITHGWQIIKALQDDSERLTIQKIDSDSLPEKLQNTPVGFTNIGELQFESEFYE